MNAVVTGAFPLGGSELDDLFFRDQRQPAKMPAQDNKLTQDNDELHWSDFSRLIPAMAPTLAAGLVLAIAAGALASGAALSSLVPVGLVVSAFAMMAIAVNRDRLLWLAAATVNLALVVTGVWWVMAGELDVPRLFAWHLVLVAVTLLAPARVSDEPMRVWLGAEMGLLILVALTF